MTTIRKLSEVNRGKVGPYALISVNRGLSERDPDRAWSPNRGGRAG